MKKILVATDFSTRSDRAIRRATVLAKKFDAAVSLVHVVDDDRPKRIVDADRESTSMLLEEQARSVREIDGVDCSADVLLAAPSDEIIKAAEAGGADILVIGPHRHHAFLDVFVGNDGRANDPHGPPATSGGERSSRGLLSARLGCRRSLGVLPRCPPRFSGSQSRQGCFSFRGVCLQCSGKKSHGRGFGN